MQFYFPQKNMESKNQKNSQNWNGTDPLVLVLVYERLDLQMWSQMAFVNSVVVEVPPRSAVRYFPSAIVLTTASWILSAWSVSFKWCNIETPLNSKAVGFARFYKINIILNRNHQHIITIFSRKKSKSNTLTPDHKVRTLTSSSRTHQDSSEDRTVSITLQILATSFTL